MSQALDQYKALSASGSLASSVFVTIQVALIANKLDTESRKALVQLILDDLRALLLDNNVSRLSNNDASRAFSTLKSLGGTRDAAEILGRSHNLLCLLNLSSKIDDSVQNNALRCIANTVLLDESARATFVGPEVNGGEVCIDLLQKSSVEYIFLASRILFLCTASISASPFIQSIVEQKRPNVPGSGTAVDIIGAKLDDLTEMMERGNNAVKDAITDLLKLIFNLCTHYPKVVDCELQSPGVAALNADDKVMGYMWSARLDSLLPPLLHAFHVDTHSDDPLEAPLPHVIHSLITVPVVPTNRDLWFGKQLSEPGSCSEKPILRDSALRAYALLDKTLAHFLPGDVHPDDSSIQTRLPDGECLDSLVSPLVILITRFCLGDEDAKVRVRDWFIPQNLDRSSPLEARSDLLGRCLRLLQSVYHSRLKVVCGEMFFAMCDSNPMTLSGYLGYGNVAGFLFQKGVVSAPARSSLSGAPATTPAGLPINPITGIIEKEHEPVSMTQEEHEREVEKLFVLFERMERTGMLSPGQNPIRRVIQEGKLPRPPT